MEGPKYSIIIPVFNRPEEVDELLKSISQQTYRDFEVILVEDGSTETCEHVQKKYVDRISVRYFYQENAGPGPSRNFGYREALGNFFIVFDSDCILPPDYLKDTNDDLQRHPLDAWGGPDRASADFTPLQQAMGYTMSSFFTTGGIRGGRKMVGRFQPRSFNMGISRAVFERTGGFAFDRYAEDIELSLRIMKAGFNVGYIERAFVYHKRRTTLNQFYRQVFNFGRGRVLVGRRHPGEVKLTHWFPALFIAGLWGILILGFVNYRISVLLLALYVVYMMLIFIDAWIQTRLVLVALMSIPSAFVQLTGYGSGFIREKLSFMRK